jgi:hypothetical protein
MFAYKMFTDLARFCGSAHAGVDCPGFDLVGFNRGPAPERGPEVRRPSSRELTCWTNTLSEDSLMCALFALKRTCPLTSYAMQPVHRTHETVNDC